MLWIIIIIIKTVFSTAAQQKGFGSQAMKLRDCERSQKLIVKYIKCIKEIAISNQIQLS